MDDMGIAELKVAIKPELKQQNGFVHGGVISYAADNALTYAGGSVLGPIGRLGQAPEGRS